MSWLNFGDDTVLFGERGKRDKRGFDLPDVEVGLCSPFGKTSQLPVILLMKDLHVRTGFAGNTMEHNRRARLIRCRVKEQLRNLSARLSLSVHGDYQSMFRVDLAVCLS